MSRLVRRTLAASQKRSASWTLLLQFWFLRVSMRYILSARCASSSLSPHFRRSLSSSARSSATSISPSSWGRRLRTFSLPSLPSLASLSFPSLASLSFPSLASLSLRIYDNTCEYIRITHLTTLLCFMTLVSWVGGSLALSSLMETREPKEESSGPLGCGWERTARQSSPSVGNSSLAWLKRCRLMNSPSTSLGSSTQPPRTKEQSRCALSLTMNSLLSPRRKLRFSFRFCRQCANQRRASWRGGEALGEQWRVCECVTLGSFSSSWWLRFWKSLASSSPSALSLISRSSRLLLIFCSAPADTLHSFSSSSQYFCTISSSLYPTFALLRPATPALSFCLACPPSLMQMISFSFVSALLPCGMMRLFSRFTFCFSLSKSSGLAGAAFSGGGWCLKWEAARVAKQCSREALLASCRERVRCSCFSSFWWVSGTSLRIWRQWWMEWKLLCL